MLTNDAQASLVEGRWSDTRLSRVDLIKGFALIALFCALHLFAFALERQRRFTQVPTAFCARSVFTFEYFLKQHGVPLPREIEVEF